jgi:hypothetical protein
MHEPKLWLSYSPYSFTQARYRPQLLTSHSIPVDHHEITHTIGIKTISRNANHGTTDNLGTFSASNKSISRKPSKKAQKLTSKIKINLFDFFTGETQSLVYK